MVNIRLARIDDCLICSELSKIEELMIANGSYVSEDYFKNFVDSDELFFVAEIDNNIVGYILGEPIKGNLAFLGLFTVEIKHRKKGIGKNLINTFSKKCKSKGLLEIIFYAPSFNKDTIEFYKKQGFIEGKSHTNFYSVLK